MVGMYPCVFLGVGFMYASSYDMKYSFIFDLSYLKNNKFSKVTRLLNIIEINNGKDVPNN